MPVLPLKASSGHKYRQDWTFQGIRSAEEYSRVQWLFVSLYSGCEGDDESELNGVVVFYSPDVKLIQLIQLILFSNKHNEKKRVSVADTLQNVAPVTPQ